MYKVFKIFYKVVEKLTIDCQKVNKKTKKKTEENEVHQKPTIDYQKTNKILYKAYEILCREICKCDAQALDMDTKPQELLSGIKNLIQIRLDKLDEPPKEIDDFLRNSSIMLDPRTVK
ncbi:hypothetical protein [Cardinium endosymbiont of Dermatophagoides farinae]|uniref:hypothetical protein n=1 Tax=Cardinium endosymbiont of Dermatophagoides farinae TaxID=2597823 RepID=UPI001183EFE7|nr:hypothetical protein [Cardinium endosymbiont of Dermatophagoides farinae]TSJ80613.1 hypothetical protein FPG78_00785 [Cardinium endosymbiont of Dermatophagoides farinae]